MVLSKISDFVITIEADFPLGAIAGSDSGTFSFIFPMLFHKGTSLKWCLSYNLWLMHISATGGPKMSVTVTRFSFWAVRIPNISDGYPCAFR